MGRARERAPIWTDLSFNGGGVGGTNSLKSHESREVRREEGEGDQNGRRIMIPLFCSVVDYVLLSRFENYRFTGLHLEMVQRTRAETIPIPEESLIRFTIPHFIDRQKESGFTSLKLQNHNRGVI